MFALLRTPAIFTPVRTVRITKLSLLTMKRWFGKRDLPVTKLPEHSSPAPFSAENNYRFFFKSPVIAIDFDAIKPCVAVLDKGIPKVLENDDLKRSPSTTYLFKYLLKHLVMTIQSKIFMIFTGEDSHNKRTIRNQDNLSSTKGINRRLWNPNAIFTPHQSTISVIRKMKKKSEIFLNATVRDVIIAVPIYFKYQHILNIKIACAIAGFRTIQFIDKQTAAWVAHGMLHSGNHVIAICNMSTTSFVSTVFNSVNGDIQIYPKIDELLGEEDFDDVLLNFFKETFMKQHGIDINNDIVALCRLREAAIEARTKLLQVPEVEINIPNLTADSAGKFQHLNIKLTVEEYENLVDDLLQRIISHCKDVMETTKYFGKADKVLLVGEMTKMPKIKKIVEEIFQQSPDCTFNNPGEVVAIGAATQAFLLSTCCFRPLKYPPVPRS